MTNKVDSDISDSMIPIPGYEGKYYLDISVEPYRIWSKRRAGCKGVYMNIECFGRKRFARLLNKNGVSELKPVSDLSWAAHFPETNLKEHEICFHDRNVQNENITNLYTKPLYIRDESDNIIVSFS